VGRGHRSLRSGEKRCGQGGPSSRGEKIVSYNVSEKRTKRLGRKIVSEDVTTKKSTTEEAIAQKRLSPNRGSKRGRC